jgi:hypothetical protein
VEKKETLYPAPTWPDARRSNMNELPISDRPFLIYWQTIAGTWKMPPVGGRGRVIAETDLSPLRSVYR